MAIQRSSWWKLVLISSLFLVGLVFVSCGSNEYRSQDQGDSNANENPLSGEVLYMNNCASCHGTDGQLGLSGASDLSKSKIPVPEIKKILLNGRKGMPVMKEILGTDQNIESVSNYVIELRK